MIALRGERAIGWCAVGPRSRYPQYEDDDAGRGAWAIPCIYVAPAADRPRVARALIEAAAELAACNGAVALDGPPPWWLPGDEAAIANATTWFLDNGFERVGAGARMPELRRNLTER